MKLTKSTVLAVLAGALHGATVTDAALGSSLAGATVTVTRFGGGLSSAVFVPDGTGAIASAPLSFVLTVTAGDTAAATWTLTNTDPSGVFLNLITAVTIDLTLSGNGLFDTGTLPSTTGSGPGVPGVTGTGGVGVAGTTDLLPWTDPANAGDMFLSLSITFDGGLSSGAFSSWMDDTDTTAIPEPGTLPTTAVLITALAALRRRDD